MVIQLAATKLIHRAFTCNIFLGLMMHSYSTQDSTVQSELQKASIVARSLKTGKFHGQQFMLMFTAALYFLYECRNNTSFVKTNSHYLVMNVRMFLTTVIKQWKLLMNVSKLPNVELGNEALFCKLFNGYVM